MKTLKSRGGAKVNLLMNIGCSQVLSMADLLGKLASFWVTFLSACGLLYVLDEEGAALLHSNCQMRL